MLMGSNDGAVNDEPFQVGVLERLKNPLPDPLLRPAVEPPPHAVPQSEPLGQVPPRSARLANPKDSIDEEAVVLGGDTRVASLAGEERMETTPRFVADLMTSQCGRSVAQKSSVQVMGSLRKLPEFCPHGLANKDAWLRLDHQRARPPRPFLENDSAVKIQRQRQSERASADFSYQSNPGYIPKLGPPPEPWSLYLLHGIRASAASQSTQPSLVPWLNHEGIRL